MRLTRRQYAAASALFASFRSDPGKGAESAIGRPVQIQFLVADSNYKISAGLVSSIEH